MIGTNFDCRQSLDTERSLKPQFGGLILQCDRNTFKGLLSLIDCLRISRFSRLHAKQAQVSNRPRLILQYQHEANIGTGVLHLAITQNVSLTQTPHDDEGSGGRTWLGQPNHASVLTPSRQIHRAFLYRPTCEMACSMVTISGPDAYRLEDRWNVRWAPPNDPDAPGPLCAPRQRLPGLLHDDLLMSSFRTGGT